MKVQKLIIRQSSRRWKRRCSVSWLL